MAAGGQTYLAQVTKMCELPPEAPLISNLGAFSPKKEEFTDEVLLVSSPTSAPGVSTSTCADTVLARVSVLTLVAGGGSKACSYTEDLPVRGSLKVVVRVL